MGTASSRSESGTLLIGDMFSDSWNFAFNRDNPPNADILLPSLRQSGYTLETAIGDLADNPLDANADTIVITLAKTGDEWSVSVADNGSGMDDGTLDQMLRLGSRVDHHLARDLGAFGLGSTTASLYLGRCLHVITSPTPGIVWSGATDLDITIAEQRFVKHQAAAQPAEISLFQDAFTQWGLPVPPTGTLVRITKGDNIGRVLLRPAVNAVKEYVGQTYRYFINAGKQFYVNGELVSAIDPLQRKNPETLILFEDSFTYEFPKGHERYGEAETVGVILVQLPGGDVATQEDRKYNQDNQGLYLLRNRREIVTASTFDPKLFHKHNDYNRFRGELLFSGTMDKDLGVTFQKSSLKEHPSQSLRDKVAEVVRPYIRQVRNFAKASRPQITDDVQHDEAAKIIEQRSHLLLKPNAEEDFSPEPAPGDGKPRSPRGRIAKGSLVPPDLRKRTTGLADQVCFAVADGDPRLPIYETRVIGKTIEITYNAGHPFYQRFFLENQENRALTAAVDYLVYSMANAELHAVEDAQAQFITTMREHMSTNLRQLLTT